MDLSSFIDVIPEYQGWVAGAALPDLSVGPTEVPYTLERLKADNVNVRITRCEHAAIVTSVKKIIKDLNEKTFTEKSLLDLISLALALRTKEEEEVFSLPNEMYYTLDEGAVNSTTPVPSSFGDVNSQIEMLTTIMGRTSEMHVTPANDYEETIQHDGAIYKAGPYWACSFLRLLTKEPEGWRRAMGAIKTQFGTFYGMASSFITGYEPIISHAQQVKTAMDTFRRVSRIIVSVAATTEKQVVPNSKCHHMLIYFMSQHLSFTGMSTYPMITSILHKMRGMPPPIILSLLTIEENRPALRMYYDIATTRDAPSDSDRSKRDFMWKYARLVNEGFFLTLQNKRNVELLYGLVILSKKLGLASSGSYSDPENMAVLVGKQSIKDDAAEFAEAVYTLYKSQVAAGPEATGTDRYLASRKGIRVAPRPVTVNVAQKRPAPVEGENAATPMNIDPTSSTAAKRTRPDIEDELSNL